MYKLISKISKTISKNSKNLVNSYKIFVSIALISIEKRAQEYIIINDEYSEPYAIVNL